VYSTPHLATPGRSRHAAGIEPKLVHREPGEEPTRPPPQVSRGRPWEVVG
jgi:hypothetical protein